MPLSTMASLAERLSKEPELTRLIFAILDPQLPRGLLADIRTNLKAMTEGVPVFAWSYEHDEGIFLVYALTKMEADSKLEVILGEPVQYDRIKRCRAMDGLSYNRLHGLYTNLWSGALCADFASCGTRIVPSDGKNGKLVNADTRGEAIVVGDILYCSRFCADHAG